jgi:hypothetical protein
MNATLLSNALIAPPRTLPQIEWSVALSQDSCEPGRFAYYGLSTPEIHAFFQALGHDAVPVLTDLHAQYGPPTQIAVGRAPGRDKLYYFLSGHNPYFIGVDFRTGGALAFKRYRQVLPSNRLDVFPLLPPALHDPVSWLLSQTAFQGSGLFHLVCLSRSTHEEYSGVHVGLAPNWAGLLNGDATLIQKNLVRTYLGHIGLEHHWDKVESSLLSAPTAWTCYLSAVLRPDGTVGANIYGRTSPVMRHNEGLSIVEPSDDGALPRPVVIDFQIKDHPEVTVRARTQGTDPYFIRVGPWKFEYKTQSEEGSVPAMVLARIKGIVTSAAAELGPCDAVALSRALKEHDHTTDVILRPDMRPARS